MGVELIVAAAVVGGAASIVGAVEQRKANRKQASQARRASRARAAAEARQSAREERILKAQSAAGFGATGLAASGLSTSLATGLTTQGRQIQEQIASNLHNQLVGINNQERAANTAAVIGAVQGIAGSALNVAGAFGGGGGGATKKPNPADGALGTTVANIGT